MTDARDDVIDNVTHVADEPDATPAPPAATTTERTVAFYVDPQASTLLLTETVVTLIESLKIERGIVDLSSLPGLAVAEAFQKSHVHFDELYFGQTGRYFEHMPERHPVLNPYLADDAAAYREYADNVVQLPVGDLGAVDANVVLIPAISDRDLHVDLDPATLPGLVMFQMEVTQREFLIVDSPERGLSRQDDGTFRRRLIHIEDSSRAA